MLHLTDEPRATDRRVSLRWTGGDPHLWKKVGLTIFLLPFLVAPLLIPLSTLSQPESVPWHLAVAVGFMLITYALVLGLVWMVGAASGRWVRVDWDADGSVLEATYRGSLIWLTRTRRIAFRDVQRVTFGFGAETGRETPLSCEVAYGPPGAPPSTLHLELLVAGVDTRTEALDLARRVARALRWEGWIVRRSDDLRLEVELARQAQGEATRLPAAPLDAPPLPGRKLPPFSPSSFAGPAALLEWSPGRRVRLEKPPIPTGRVVAGLALMLGLATAPIALALRFYGGQGLGALLLIPAVEAPLFLGVVAYLVFRRARQRWEVVLDWAGGTLRVVSDGRTEEHRLAEIVELAVWGRVVTMHESTGEHRSTYQEHSCRVVARLAGGGELPLAETHDHRDPDAPYLVCAPMAAELAAALGVGWHWEGYRGA